MNLSPKISLSQTDILRLALPKGRMKDGVFRLLAEAGISVNLGDRGYRPRLSWQAVEAKLLKPQNAIEMIASGTRDLGFAGADWVAELDADVVDLLDTGLNPVRLVAALPLADASCWTLTVRSVASEYGRLTTQWMTERGIDGRLVRSYGATEVFPPEDADCIVDNTATGATLQANGLVIVDELMNSSTRLFANRRALDDPSRRDRIEDLVLLLNAVLTARDRVMIEVNVSSDRMDAVIGCLPCMREPTVAQLANDRGYALKVAAPRTSLPVVIPAVKAAGGTDIVVTNIAQIVS